MSEFDRDLPDDSTGSTVKSVEVAVSILDAISEMPPPARVTELAKALGMTKAKISRHLQTLLALGLVEQAQVGEGYLLGWRLLKFARAAVYRSNLADIARPHLSQLCTETGQTALLATPGPEGATVILSVPNLHEPGIMVHPGMVLRLPGSPAARLIQYFEGRTPEPPQVAQNLRAYGVDVQTDPRGNGLGGIAAPIFESSGAIGGTIGIILPSSLLSPEPALYLLEQVRLAARAIQARYAEGAEARRMPGPAT